MDPEVYAFYATEYREQDRLVDRAHGILERVRTQELLARFLPPPPARVLDVGGGTGVHAEWLAAQRYEVHVVDPVDEHVRLAGGLAGVTAEVGDARALTEGDASQDAVLLLGPLYHLTERDDRLLALHEARRVARSGAPVVAAGISRYAVLGDLSSDGRLTADTESFVRRVQDTGQFRAGVAGFTTAYFHHAEELAAELTAAGLSDVDVYGVEGPAGPTLRAVGMDHLDDLLDAAVRAARIVERDPRMIHASGHLLAVGRVPD